VTVCIAALCEKRNKIVLVTDRKLSFGSFSSDNAVLKLYVLSGYWLALYAGNDVAYVPFIMERASAAVAKMKNPGPEQVAEGLRAACQWYRAKQAEANYLSKHGFTMRDFKKNGLSQLGEAIYTDLHQKIESFNLNLSFIVVGFDSKKKGHLVFTDHQTVPQSYTDMGYCAIGIGFSSATAMLAYHHDNSDISDLSSVEETVYCLCEAKFMSESASDVGRTTFVHIWDSEEFSTILDDNIEKIRTAWKGSGAPRIPKDIVREIPSMIVTPRPPGNS